MFVLLNIPLIQHKGDSLFHLALQQKRIDFLKNDSVILVKMEGEVPDSLLGKEALALEMGIIIRDTTKIPVREQLFKENFESIVDSIAYIPFSGGKQFTIAAGAVEKNKMNIIYLAIMA